MAPEETEQLSPVRLKPELYLPKRSLVLLFCFILVIMKSAQYHLVDAVMDAVLRDEATGELLKGEHFLFELAIHLGYPISGPLTAILVVKTAKAKNIILFGFIVSCISTFCTPFGSHSLYALMLARVFTGIGLGISVVAMYQLILTWIPSQEYTRAITFLTSGYYGGMIFSNLWGIVFIKVYGWKSVFYWFSAIPLIFLPLWSFVVTETPEDNLQLTSDERIYITNNAISPMGQPLQLKVLFTSKVVWTLFFCNILFQFAHTGIFSVVQFYIVDILWIDITFAALTIVILYYNTSAMVFDYLFYVNKSEKTGENNHPLREIVGTVGLLGCAIFLKFFCGGSNSVAVRLVAFGIALAFLANAFAGHVSAMFDVIPRHVPLLIGLSFIPVGIMNIWAHIGLRWVLDSTGNWSFVLSSIAASLSFAGILWATFGSTKRLL